MSDESKELLETLTQADSVPGHEAEVRAIFTERLKGVGKIETDRLGNVHCTKQGPPEGPRVLIESGGQADRVGPHAAP